MKVQTPLLPFGLFTASCLLVGCGNDLSVPKSSSTESATLSATAVPTNTTTELAPAQNPSSQPTLSQNQSNLQATSPSETPPQKTSMWVTLAGMKCH